MRMITTTASRTCAAMNHRPDTDGDWLDDLLLLAFMAIITTCIMFVAVGYISRYLFG